MPSKRDIFDLTAIQSRFKGPRGQGFKCFEWPIVWVAATRDATELKRKVADILAREYADTESPC